MLYALLFSLKTQFILFNLLRYITFRSVAAFITAFLIGVLIAPYFIKLFKRIGVGQAIRTDGPETHRVKSGTPTMGGLIIIISALVAILLWSIFNFYVLTAVVCIVLFAAIGFADDFMKVKFRNSRGISGEIKILLQIVVSFILVTLLFLNPSRPDIFWAFYVPIFDKPLFIWPPILGYAFYMFTVIAFANATNLADGLDGLAVGMGIMLFIPFAIFAYVIGNFIAAEYLKFPFIVGTGELVVVLSAMIGGFAAFLWYNAHPAEVFMGDTGSLPMGGLIALVAVVLKQEVLLLVAGGMFVLETVSVVLQKGYFKYTKKRYGQGRRIFLMSPIHHHFEKKGWKETQVVIRFWVLSALCALLALATLKIR